MRLNSCTGKEKLRRLLTAAQKYLPQTRLLKLKTLPSPSPHHPSPSNKGEKKQGSEEYTFILSLEWIGRRRPAASEVHPHLLSTHQPQPLQPVSNHASPSPRQLLQLSPALQPLHPACGHQLYNSSPAAINQQSPPHSRGPPVKSIHKGHME